MLHPTFFRVHKSIGKCTNFPGCKEAGMVREWGCAKLDRGDS